MLQLLELLLEMLGLLLDLCSLCHRIYCRVFRRKSKLQAPARVKVLSTEY
jgi:hypothetical protein